MKSKKEKKSVEAVKVDKPKKARKPLKMLHVFIIGISVAELLITIAVMGLYFAFSSVTHFQAAYLSTTAGTIFLITVITVIIAWRTGRKLLKPITDIQDAAEAVVHGDFSVRLPENSGILEIKSVATDFNIMVEELGNIEILKDDFVANVSHEFKTPLSVIEGYVTLLQGNISESEKDEYTSIILQNTEKLSTLTGNILSISKLENRAIPLESEEFRLDKQICDIMVDFNEFWEEKEMEIDMDLDSVTISGVRSLLSRVWSNLIQNAIKFSNQKGYLKITCKEREEGVVLTFEDHGIGMSSSTAKHVFDKFYQGDSSRSIEGNGLGLALVKQIIDLSGGSITVESALGVGSTFTVVLPRSIKE